jgi:hypothetical protein
MKRLAAHPITAEALADGSISASWAREICAWTDQLPEDQRGEADTIVLAAAAGGATLADLAGLAEEMRRRSAAPDQDRDGAFDDRSLRLGVTFRGAGRLDGDLTAGCAAALSAVLEALGKKAGPEDDRTATQRRHDALEEACRRLIASGMLPQRAGQATQAQVWMTLRELRDMPGASAVEAAWITARAGEPGHLAGPAAAAAACDSQLAPLVTGHVDQAALQAMRGVFLSAHGLNPDGSAAGGCGCTCGRCTCPARRPLRADTLARLDRALLAMAADVLSGPGGLASWLRTALAGDPAGPAGAASPSLPLDISLPLDSGQATERVPGHLRRAVAFRDRHCRFPGCPARPAACHVHHVIPRSRGGPTRLSCLILLCSFHHLIAVHHWGWQLRLHADGSVTATSPDGQRTLHDVGPPLAA